MQLSTDPFIMIGSFGQEWKDAQINEAVAAKKLRLSYHHLCHFELSVEPGLKTPSKSVWVTASNYRIRNHACGKGYAQVEKVKKATSILTQWTTTSSPRIFLASNRTAT